MNNAGYFNGEGGRMGINHAFETYVKRRGWRLEAMRPGDALSFAASNAMTTLEWNVGDVVQVDQPGSSYHGRYATIDSFGEAACMTCASETQAARLYLRFAEKDSPVSMYAHHIRKPDFPPELVELVKSQMRASCPLKEPSCMEREAK